MKWQEPAPIKVYEALGAIVDGRIEVEGELAKVFSSSGNKYYEVNYDPDGQRIMSNDNSAYWQGNLGYPAIAFLFKTGRLTFRAELANLLKGVAWKDLNTKFKNNYEQTLEFILRKLSTRERSELESYVHETLQEIKSLDLSYLGEKQLPPKGY